MTQADIILWLFSAPTETDQTPADPPTAAEDQHPHRHQTEGVAAFDGGCSQPWTNSRLVAPGRWKKPSQNKLQSVFTAEERVTIPDVFNTFWTSLQLHGSDEQDKHFNAQ